MPRSSSAISLTAATRPTFARWRENAARHRDTIVASIGEEDWQRFADSCDVLEGFWDDGTLGYGLPAAIGAKLAEPQRPAISLMGDGGIQFTLPELASAVEARVGIVVLLWNNAGYGEIKRYMQRRDIEPIGVDIYTPDLLAIARGFGCAAERARDHAHLAELLRSAPQDRPLIIEVQEAAPFHP